MQFKKKLLLQNLRNYSESYAGQHNTVTQNVGMVPAQQANFYKLVY
jgi:hypothetical protein